MKRSRYNGVMRNLMPFVNILHKKSKTISDFHSYTVSVPTRWLLLNSSNSTYNQPFILSDLIKVTPKNTRKNKALVTFLCQGVGCNFSWAEFCSTSTSLLWCSGYLWPCFKKHQPCSSLSVTDMSKSTWLDYLKLCTLGFPWPLCPILSYCYCYQLFQNAAARLLTRTRDTNT